MLYTSFNRDEISVLTTEQEMMVNGESKECQQVKNKVNFPPCDPMRERERIQI
jgi:hypothetical protein